MINLGIGFYVVGALFTLYLIAATWRSKDADPRVPAPRPERRARTLTVDRRLARWLRARQR